MSPDVDLRWVTFAIWGLGTVAVYLVNLVREAHLWSLHRDDRAKRDLTVAGALFLTGLSSALAIWVVLFGQVGTGIRPLFVALSLGAFLGNGIVLVTWRRKRDPAEPDPEVQP